MVRRIGKKVMSKYMIHTCPARLWYVEEYLFPSLLQQGIMPDDIVIYNDSEHDGNLMSTLKSFRSLPKNGLTWHLQDDVVVSKQFASVTQYFPPAYKVVCGFCSLYDDETIGAVFPKNMWYSFPCIRIENRLAHQFISWVKHEDEINRHFVQISNNMFDDSLFKDFMKDRHPYANCFNMCPNLVEHIDDLIGGSTLHARKEKIKSKFWNEPGLVDELKKRLM